MNRPFNRSAFNRPAKTTSSTTGIALIKFSGSLNLNRTVSIPANQSSVKISANLTPTVEKYIAGKSEIKLSSQANATKVLDAGIGLAAIVLGGSVVQSVQGEAVITLEDLNLAPGDELVINTTDLTVTVNGQNGTQYFSPDSEFFTLLNGVNTIVYSDTEAERNINLDVIWKDRWL
jgi:hypothetical protein